MGLEVLAQELLTAAAVEALAAEFGVVRNDTFSDGKALHLGANGSDNADGLVS